MFEGIKDAIHNWKMRRKIRKTALPNLYTSTESDGTLADLIAHRRKLEDKDKSEEPAEIEKKKVSSKKKIKKRLFILDLIETWRSDLFWIATGKSLVRMKWEKRIADKEQYERIRELAMKGMK